MAKFIDLLHQLPSNIFQLSHCPLQKRSSQLSCTRSAVVFVHVYWEVWSDRALSFVADRDGLSGNLTIPPAVYVTVTKYPKSLLENRPVSVV